MTHTLIKSKLLLLVAAASVSTANGASFHSEQPTEKKIAGYSQSTCHAIPTFYFKKPQKETVDFTGFVEDPRNAAQGSVLYPAPSAAGFFAAILTHAIVSNSVQNAQRNAHIAQSNEVLAPFSDAINTFKSDAFLEDAVANLTTIQNKKLYSDGMILNECDFIVKMDAVYTITQDKSAVFISNLISISQNTLNSNYSQTVRVISSPYEKDDVVQFWNADNGAILKQKSVKLLSNSIDILLNDFFNTYSKKGTQKTIRYRFGLKEKFERAEILEADCEQILFKTLRGELFSVPTKHDEENETCNNEKG